MQKFPMTHYEWLMRSGTEIMVNDIINTIGRKPDISFNDFSDFFSNSIYMPIMQEHQRTYGLNNTNLFARHIYHCYKMEMHGRKVYYMSKEVCNLLKNTRLTIDAEFIESPFEQIFIYTDQNDIMLSDNTGTLPMKGIYIQLTKEGDKKFLRFVVTSGIDGIEKRLDVNYFGTFDIPEHGDLEHIADKDIKRFIAENKILNVDIDLDIMKRVFIFSVNALLYLGCKNVDFINFTPENLTEAMLRKKNNAKRQKLEKALSKTAQIPFIIINPKKGDQDNNCNTGTGKSLDHQIFVSGHWRGQWSGPVDCKKKEIIRIKSYLKGVGLKEKENKPYLIK